MSSKVINLTTDGKGKPGKRAKSASPTLGSASTSIIDNILKDRALHGQNGKSSPGKKLIIDLAKDNFIITDAKPSADSKNISKPVPIKPLVSKAIDPVIINVPSHQQRPKQQQQQTLTTNKSKHDEYDLDMDFSQTADITIKKSGRRSPPTAAGSLGNTAISREKMDKLKALDAVFLNSTPSPEPPIKDMFAHLGHTIADSKPKTSDPLDFVFEGLSAPRKSPSPIQIIPTAPSNTYAKPSNQKDSNPVISSSGPVSKVSDIKIIKQVGASANNNNNNTSTSQPIDQDLTRQKLESVNRNIAKIQGKIHEKGAKEKYAVMLKDLEKQKQKYESRLATVASTGPALTTTAHAGNKSLVPAYAPPSYQEVMLGSPTTTTSPKPRPGTTSPEPIRPNAESQITMITTTKQIAEAEKLATDQELARIRELFPDSTNQGTGITKHRQSTRPKEVQSLFNVSNNLETLREKQRHLELQHKKLEEQYAHKMKQIDRIRTQKEEMTKLSALEQERRKIYEMELKLKRLDKEQWEEQQRLRKELQTINLVNLQAISRNNNNDVGEFYSLKQQLGGRQTAISPVNTTLPALDAQFRLVDWFAGFMGGQSMKQSGGAIKKTFQPESFKDVELGPITHGLNAKPANSITGYHYYNNDLPSTAWLSGVENDNSECHDYQIGCGPVRANIIEYITTAVTNSMDSLTSTASIDVVAVDVVDRINQLTTQLGCTNTINTAKCLDFIVDKLDTRTGVQLHKRSKLLDILTSIIACISNRLIIRTLD